MQQFEDKVESLLSIPPYGQPPEERQAGLLEILKEELDYACQRHAGYKNYVQHWPLDYRSASSDCRSSFSPSGNSESRSSRCPWWTADEIKRTLTSSATTSQLPSRVVLDSPTARRMTKGVVSIVRDFIGPARRPYLVVDTPGFRGSSNGLGARGAAIQGLQPFASETTCCLSLDDQGDLKLDRDKLKEFAKDRQDTEVLVYGFTLFLESLGEASDGRGHLSQLAESSDPAQRRLETFAGSGR